MYAEFYGFREQPFNITPDPRFLFLNDCYQEALAALGYGVNARKGFISLVGEAGTGKTTLLRRVLDTLEPSTKTVLLLNPSVTFDEILEHILLELGVPTDGGGKLVRLQRLNEFLIEHTAAGGNVALFIDEAQDLRPSVLEELRLLSNLETAREKILQIILSGQPELEETLANPRLRQLRQRVTLRVRLRALSPSEVAAYVRSRLERAGAASCDLFEDAALERIAHLSQGVPRLVNVLCDAALVAAYAAAAQRVTAAIVAEVWRDYAADGAAPEALPPVSALDLAPTPAAPADLTPAPAPPVPEAPPARAAAPTVPVAGTPPAPEPASPEPEPPSPAPAAPAAARPARRTLSIPMAASLVVALAALLFAVSKRDEWLDGLPPVEPPGAPAAAAPEPAAPLPADPLPVGDGPVSAGEAAQVVEEFRAAYEARNLDRLLRLFAADAAENGRRGRDAIASGYRSSLSTLADVHYTLADVLVEPRGARADVRAPFHLTYRQASGGSGEIRGEAEWQVERRDGRARIVALNYRFEPGQDPASQQ